MSHGLYRGRGVWRTPHRLTSTGVDLRPRFFVHFRNRSEISRGRTTLAPLARLSLESSMLRRSILTFALAAGLVAPAWALCPNGVVEPPETCDDGNTIPGDGCSPLCLLEVPNLPPICDDAFANPDSLWPPNHKFVPIGIDGVHDPDGDPVAIAVTAVAQDEPLDAGTCGNASGLGTDVVLLRSDRNGEGDGRVYHVAFRADDPAGAFCTGEVDVCVRHDNGHGGGCGDQGPLFDSAPGVCVPGDDDDCHLEDCVPPPPIVIGNCDDV